MDYETDEALQEIHDEMYRQEEERPKGALSNVDPKTKFWISLAIGVVALFVFSGRLTIMQGAMAIGVVWIILSFTAGGMGQRSELTWVECMIRLNDTLKFLQKHPIGDEAQIPKGEVRITPIGRKQWYEGKPLKRSFRVDIYDQEIDITEMYFVEVDVFTGDILTFRHSPEGVYGDETKDIKLMPTYDMLIQRKRDKYLGKGLGGNK
jgi:hypothetical protein